MLHQPTDQPQSQSTPLRGALLLHTCPWALHPRDARRAPDSARATTPVARQFPKRPRAPRVQGPGAGVQANCKLKRAAATCSPVTRCLWLAARAMWLGPHQRPAVLPLAMSGPLVRARGGCATLVWCCLFRVPAVAHLAVWQITPCGSAWVPHADCLHGDLRRLPKCSGRGRTGGRYNLPLVHTGIAVVYCVWAHC